MLKEPRPKYKGKKKFIKSLVCVAQGMHGLRCSEGLDECHYRKGTHGANVKNNRLTWPGCRVHHSHQHQIGEKRFWHGKPIGPLCEDIHDAWRENNLDKAFVSAAIFIGMRS